MKYVNLGKSGLKVAGASGWLELAKSPGLADHPRVYELWSQEAQGQVDLGIGRGRSNETSQGQLHFTPFWYVS
jgi:hypothetical protein